MDTEMEGRTPGWYVQENHERFWTGTTWGGTRPIGYTPLLPWLGTEQPTRAALRHTRRRGIRREWIIVGIVGVSLIALLIIGVALVN